MQQDSLIYTIKSFVVVLYNGSQQPLRTYRVPISVAAPFANRLFEEMLGKKKVSEPWYTLEPRYEQTFERSPKPVGPTSLYGRRYEHKNHKKHKKKRGALVQLHPNAAMRSVVVRLLDFQRVLYEGEYSVDDLFLAGAQYLLSSEIGDGTWAAQDGPYYYAMIASPQAIYRLSEPIFPEDVYQVEGVFRLPPQTRQNNTPRIVFRKVRQPPLLEREPSSFVSTATLGKGTPHQGQIFMPQALYDQLRERLHLSHYYEEGGYLLGHVYRVVGSPENEEAAEFRWIVEITDVLMAEDTIGSAATLLFTGDSWSKISRRRAQYYPQHKLVGWFHTHLFPASDSFGLSGLDQNMHAWYLPQPWQIAVLLNLEQDNQWSVRCYQRGPDGDLIETPFELF